jgi:hypothetical protein
MTANDDERIGTYLLKKTNGEPVVLSNRLWKVAGIYLSDICLAIRLEPNKQESNVNGNDQTRKDDLYALMRGIKNLAIEHDFVRPVAGIIAKEDFDNSNIAPETIQRWSSDQDWHRGAFILYVENGHSDCMKRLSDLLHPVIQPLSGLDLQPKEPRKMEEEFKEKYKEYKSNHPIQWQGIEEKANELIAILIQVISPEDSKKFNAKDQLDSWKADIMKKTDDLLRGT